MILEVPRRQSHTDRKCRKKWKKNWSNYWNLI